MKGLSFGRQPLKGEINYDLTSVKKQLFENEDCMRPDGERRADLLCVVKTGVQSMATIPS